VVRVRVTYALNASCSVVYYVMYSFCIVVLIILILLLFILVFEICLFMTLKDSS